MTGTPAAFVLTDPEGPNDSLRSIIFDAIERADAQGLRPFVYFYWDDCPYCVQLREQVHHPLMEAAMEGAYIVLLDAMVWGGEAADTPYSFDSVPIFFRISSNGNAIGKVDGSAWDEVTPQEMAPVLRSFFQRGGGKKARSSTPPPPDVPPSSLQVEPSPSQSSQGKGSGCMGVFLLVGLGLASVAIFDCSPVCEWLS